MLVTNININQMSLTGTGRDLYHIVNPNEMWSNGSLILHASSECFYANIRINLMSLTGTGRDLYDNFKS